MRVRVNGELADLPAPGFPVAVDGDRLKVNGKTALVRKSKGKTLVSFGGRVFVVEPPEREHHGTVLTAELRAQTPGTVVGVFATVGESVSKGQRLLVIEAMKVQSPFLAPWDGLVETMGVTVGEHVDEGQVLAVVRPQEV